MDTERAIDGQVENAIAALARLRRTFTGRRLQVLDRLAGSESEKEMAGALGLRQSSVHVHVKTIYLVLGVHSRSEFRRVCRALEDRLAIADRVA